MRRLNARGSSGRHLRLGSFCQRRAASPPSGLLPLAVTCAWVVSVSGGLPPCPRLCQSLEAAGCLSALGPPGPRPPTAARRAPPSTSEGAHGSETAPPPPDSAPLRPLSLLMPGSGHARPPLHPASLCPPGPFSPISGPLAAISSLRANIRLFLSCKSLSPTARDRFHRFRARKSLSPHRQGPFLPISGP